VGSVLLQLKCGESTYINALPVTNLIIPYGPGIIMVRRGEEPGKGLLALPGGFAMIEAWQEAGAREAWEEVNVHILDPLSSIDHFHTVSITDGSQTLVFGIVRSGQYMMLPFQPTAEVQERLVMTKTLYGALDKKRIAFMTHREVLDKYFQQLS